MQRSTGQPLFATDDVRDAHQMVVDDVGQMVGRQIVCALVKHLVIKDGAIEGHSSTDHIIDLHLYIGRDEEANDILCTASDERIDLLAREDQGIAHRGTRGSIVLEVRHSLALLLQLLRRIEGDISLARIKELLDVLTVDVTPLTLSIRAAVTAVVHSFVKANTEPLESFDDVGFCPWDEALAVGVFDTQQEFSPVRLSKKVIIESGADATYMQGSRRTGSKANAY